MTCPDRPHVHHHPGPQLVLFSGWAVAIDHGAITQLLTNDELLANRVAELLDRHGLVDVPDTPEAAVCPWPPPADGACNQ